MEKKFFTIAEAAAALKVSRQTISSWRNSGKIKSLQIDKIVRIPAEEIEKYIK